MRTAAALPTSCQQSKGLDARRRTQVAPCRPRPWIVRRSGGLVQAGADHGSSSSSLPGSKPSIGRDETPEEALERRRRESRQYEERVTIVNSVKELQQSLDKAKNNLVVIEVQGENVCDLGYEEAEYHWKDEAKQAHIAALRTCKEIKHTFQRVARDSKDATFLSHTVDDEPTPESSELCERLGIEVLPTLQFWRNGVKVWEHRGAMEMDGNLAEGVLFYDGSMANGVQAGDFVREINTREQLKEFVNGSDDHVLKIVYMALSTASPCIKIYPAVLALAKNFIGYASFARVLGDNTPETTNIMREHRIVEVPTFVFFRDGKEVGRHIGSSRADLIGKILQIQSDMGVNPPPKPVTGAVPLRKASRPVWR